MKFHLNACVILFLCINSLSSFSQRPGDQNEQNKATITGKIVDAETNQPLEYATIAVFRASDSTMAGGGIANSQGLLNIQVPFGRYYAKVQFISYQDEVVSNITLSPENPQKNLGTITIAPVAKALEEVEVVAQKDQVQLALDKKIFNVSESLAKAGGSAADILENIPSVNVDIDGNVSLRGSQNVRVFVDGKPSGLVGVSSTQALRTFPADLIERVEIITNPSARYQAEGMAGIINIVLKKDRQKGVNGSIDLTAGYPHNYGVSANLNFRRKWYNLFTNYGLRYRNFKGEGVYTQDFESARKLFFSPQDSILYFFRENERNHQRAGLSNTFRVGSDFFLNDKNTITSSFLYRISNDNNEATLAYNYLNAGRELLNSTIRNDNEEEVDQTLEFDLNYRRTFDEKDRLLTADIQYRMSGEQETSNITERFFTTEAPYLFQRSNNDENERNLLLQLDYVNPFNEKGKWETGLRSSFRKIDNDFIVEEQTDGEWINLPRFTNNLIYNEQIHAGYGIVGNKKDRFSYQLGLRAEYSIIETELVTTNQVNNRDYLNLFPTAHFTYDLNKSSSVEWSYSRRIRRPGFRELNPFFSFSDALNIRSGNPDLDPELTHALEAGYIRHFKSVSLTSSVYYRHTTGVIQHFRTQDEQGRILSMPMNLATQDDIGFEFVANADLAKWWKTNGSFNFFRSITDAGNLEEGLSSDAYSWSARMNSKMTISKGLDFQLTGFYRAPQIIPQGRTLSFYMVNAGLSKEVLKGKGTLTLNVQDILNSRRWRSETTGEGFTSVNEFQWMQRQFILNFNYRINQKKGRGEKRQRQQDGDGGGEDMGF